MSAALTSSESIHTSLGSTRQLPLTSASCTCTTATSGRIGPQARKVPRACSTTSVALRVQGRHVGAEAGLGRHERQARRRGLQAADDGVLAPLLHLELAPLGGAAEVGRQAEALHADQADDGLAHAAGGHEPVTEGPATIATTVRSFAPRRASARQNSIGAPFIRRPPIATVEPSATRAAASSMLTSLLTAGTLFYRSVGRQRGYALAAIGGRARERRGTWRRSTSRSSAPGAAGLTAGALLANEGKRVAVVEASPWLGGRGMAVPDEGFKLNVGGHLLEDSGSGITKVFEHVGKELVHGAVSSDMPVWDHDEHAGARSATSTRATSPSSRRSSSALLDTPYEELDDWDDRPLREWMLQHTRDQGVIDLWEFLAVLECMTDKWYDHSASDNLYVRKMHYAEKRHGRLLVLARAGLGRACSRTCATRSSSTAARCASARRVERVVIEDGARRRAWPSAASRRCIPNEIFEDEVLEADCVISTLPVWNVLRVVPERRCPTGTSRRSATSPRTSCGSPGSALYMATEEPVHAIDPRELATWLHTPNQARRRGFFFNRPRWTPAASPPGHPPVRGGRDHPRARRPRRGLPAQEVRAFEKDLG